MFKRKNRIKHNINIIAEFNKNDNSLYEASELINYICNISNNVQVIHELQAYPKGYRVTFKLTFESRIRDKKKGNKYTHYVARIYSWVSNNNCIQRYHFNYN